MKLTDEWTVESVLFRSFQVQDYKSLGERNFYQYDMQEYTGVDLNRAEDVRNFIDGLVYNS